MAWFARQPDPESMARPSLPDDLDRYLAAAETRYDDLQPGAEKTIVWSERGPGARTPLAVVYLHGFSACRQETYPLCDRLAARLGANLYYARLAGHGRTPDAIAEATTLDWLRDGLEALEIGRRLGERVLLVGTSTGATLATWVASRASRDELRALVFLSPNYLPRERLARVLFWPGARLLAPLVKGAYHGFEPSNEGHARYWTTRYPTEALVTMMDLVRRARCTDLASITHPLLVLYSKQDSVISARQIERQFARFGSPAKKLLEVRGVEDPKQHVLAGDILSPGTTDRVVGEIMSFLDALPA